MSFLQPWILMGLPIVALPIIIHLINQRRFQTIPWAAMMFLLAANRMSRGYARIRQWLIMLFRVLAIATLLFAVSRPLASGWLGWSNAGQVDTTFVLLDRSPSTQQFLNDANATKLDAALSQLASTFETLGSSRWVLIENTRIQPVEFESHTALLSSLTARPVTASADIGAMLEAVGEYIRRNQVGRSEVWICSDLRQNDWLPESERWPAIRDAFLEFPQSVRLHVLANTQRAPQNLAISVVNARRSESATGVDLVLTIHLRRDAAQQVEGASTEGGNVQDRIPVPIQLEVNGARSEIAVEMTGPKYELKDYRVGLEQQQARGWGRVSIPADANLADNEFYFVFDEEPLRRTVIVTDNPNESRAWELAASIPPNTDTKYSAEVVAPDGLANVEWETVSLLIWQTTISANEIPVVESFVERGGQVVFVPPRNQEAGEAFGVRLGDWQDVADNQGGLRGGASEGVPDGVTVDTWRGDQDLLTRTQSGNSLPVGELRVRRYCKLSGEFTTLATLKVGAPLLVRAPTNYGGVYFLTTTPAATDSSLKTDGVTLYVLVQRAIAAGSLALRQTQQVVAGGPGVEVTSAWKTLAGSDQVLSDERTYHRGVYTESERLVAVNRSDVEDQPEIVAKDRLETLFKGLDFHLVDTSTDATSSLIEEIWRTFLVAMMIAMIAEAALCLPKPVPIARSVP